MYLLSIIWHIRFSFTADLMHLTNVCIVIFFDEHVSVP